MCEKHVHKNEKHAWETFLATIPIGFSCRHLGGVSILTEMHGVLGARRAGGRIRHES